VLHISIWGGIGALFGGLTKASSWRRDCNSHRFCKGCSCIGFWLMLQTQYGLRTVFG